MTKYITTINPEKFDREKAERFFAGKVGKGRALHRLVIISTDRSKAEVESFPGVLTVTEDSVIYPDVAQTIIVPSPGGNPGQAIKQTNAGWALKSLSRPYHDAYYYNRGGGNVDIYILDSGVNGDLPEFGERVNYLYSLDNRTWNTSDHGTIVASVAAGSQYGVAKNADIYSCRIGDGPFPRSNIYEALDTVAWHHWAKTTNTPSVVSMSFSGLSSSLEGEHDAIQEEYRYAYHELKTAGIVLVASSGNSDYEYENWNEYGGVNQVPAAFEDVISVGAHDTNMNRSIWPSGYASCYGSNIDLWAPGTQVDCLGRLGRGMAANGTSLSCPLVAGTIALLLEGSR
ncbi:S8 family serine peptidase [Halomonas alkaliantarctica]|uniref:S8 family serine peptidase n=1 Tax=Halomonas alkaliantarctica TaxID=232346 RepID=A0ABY8LR78_9GAMM|nr:S8 family serine peptidase [Halomonas alkaliantarctica]WGI26077.1 S8 family serine peptidase [Halomonas alkaliantarctica]